MTDDEKPRENLATALRGLRDLQEALDHAGEYAVAAQLEWPIGTLHTRLCASEQPT